jgi:hypothetical protein
MSELMKRENQLDGFATYDDSVEGKPEQAQRRSVIQGALIKFTNASVWVTRDGAELAANLELVVVDVARVVQKWQDQEPVETRVLEPGQKFPDLEKLNEETPRSEWGKDTNGQPRGPWQSQHLVYLLNPETMDRFTYPTGTVGGSIAVRELVDKVQWMRRYRGAHVYPVVVLSDTYMHTNFGGRQRPNFIVKRWISFGEEQQVLPAAPPKALPPTVEATLDTFATKAQPKTVSGPTTEEELNDEIPFGRTS